MWPKLTFLPNRSPQLTSTHLTLPHLTQLTFLILILFRSWFFFHHFWITKSVHSLFIDFSVWEIFWVLCLRYIYLLIVLKLNTWCMLSKKGIIPFTRFNSKRFYWRQFHSLCELTELEIFSYDKKRGKLSLTTVINSMHWIDDSNSDQIVEQLS